MIGGGFNSWTLGRVTPHSSESLSAYNSDVQHRKRLPTERPVYTPPTAPIADSNRSGIDLAPSLDVVEQRAYFSDVNPGLAQGHDVQRWLDVEAEITQEGDQTRMHGFHNRT